MWEKICWAGAGHKWKYGACALHAGYLSIQVHTLRLCNTHCFSTATTVTRTPLKVTLYLPILYHLPPFCAMCRRHVKPWTCFVSIEVFFCLQYFLPVLENVIWYRKRVFLQSLGQSELLLLSCRCFLSCKTRRSVHDTPNVTATADRWRRMAALCPYTD